MFLLDRDDRYYITDALMGSYKPDIRRFYVLFSFCILGILQCFIWLSFSPIERNATAYYMTDDSTVTMWLNEGAILYFPFLPFVCWAMAYKKGLSVIVRCGSLMCLLATFLRLLPAMLPHGMFTPHQSVPLVHIAQCLNAAVGPLILATPSCLSSSWFPPNERTTATAMAIFSNSLGAAVGFVVAPAVDPSVVRGDNPEDVVHLLWIQFYFAIFVFLVILFFPKYPPASFIEQQQGSPLNSTVDEPIRKKKFCILLREIAIHSSFICLSLSGGLLFGVFTSWTGVLTSILPEPLTETDAGWFSFAATIASMLGGLMVGRVADSRWGRFRLKSMMLFIFAMAIVSILWFIFSLPLLGFPAMLPTSYGSLLSAIIFVGFFVGGLNPLFFEFAVEITYPISEAISGSLITLWSNIGMVIFFVVMLTNRTSSASSLSVLNIVMAIVVLVSGLIVLFVKEEYRRGKVEIAMEDGYSEIKSGEIVDVI